MLKRKATVMIAVTVIIGMILTLTAGCTFVRASSVKHMKLTDEERIAAGEARYDEFSENPDKKFEVLISFYDTSHLKIEELLAEENNIISAFHYFEANGERASGGYTECAGKNGKQVVDDYYASIYNMVGAQIEHFGDKGQEQFQQQKEAMDKGQFCISGIRLVTTGKAVEEILKSDIVELVEILKFDNNNMITPLK